MITSMMDKTKISKLSPDKKDSNKDQDTTTVVHTENYSVPASSLPNYSF